MKGNCHIEFDLGRPVKASGRPYLLQGSSLVGRIVGELEHMCWNSTWVQILAWSFIIFATMGMILNNKGAHTHIYLYLLT